MYTVSLCFVLLQSCYQLLMQQCDWLTVFVRDVSFVSRQSYGYSNATLGKSTNVWTHLVFEIMYHENVIKWNHFPRYWPFVRGFHRSPVNSPHKRPVTRSFDVFFDLRLNKWLSKQSWGWWFVTALRPLWRHCNDICTWYVINQNDGNNHFNATTISDRRTLYLGDLFTSIMYYNESLWLI